MRRKYNTMRDLIKHGKQQAWRMKRAYLIVTLIPVAIISLIIFCKY